MVPNTYFVADAETIELVCTAPDALAAVAFCDAAADELFGNVWVNADDVMLLTFDIWWDEEVDMAVDAIGGDFPRLDDGFE